ncbi:MAG: hypothetical protein WAK84_13695 [Candidatus Cybelea sp.]
MQGMVANNNGHRSEWLGFEEDAFYGSKEDSTQANRQEIKRDTSRFEKTADVVDI